jgi:hypothetical protein
MPTDVDRYGQLLQNLAVGIGAIREAIERAFGVTLPTAPRLNAEFEIITSAIYAAADQPRPVPLADNKPTTRPTLSIGSTSGLMMARTSLSTSQAWRTSLSRGRPIGLRVSDGPTRTGGKPDDKRQALRQSSVAVATSREGHSSCRTFHMAARCRSEAS